jgi:hypothetical protein
MAYMNDPPLTGRTVAVLEARELQVVAALLGRRGARVLTAALEDALRG